MVQQPMQQTSRQRVIAFAIVLLIVAVAVIIYFATRGSSSNQPFGITNTLNNVSNNLNP